MDYWIWGDWVRPVFRVLVATSLPFLDGQLLGMNGRGSQHGSRWGLLEVNFERVGGENAGQ